MTKSRSASGLRLPAGCRARPPGPVCSTNRRQPCVPSTRSSASAAFGWSVSRKSAYSRSSGFFTSPARRKCVGSEPVLRARGRAVFTAAAHRTAAAGFPFSSVAVIVSSTGLPGARPCRASPAVATRFSTSPGLRNTSRSATGRGRRPLGRLLEDGDADDAAARVGAGHQLTSAAAGFAVTFCVSGEPAAGVRPDDEVPRLADRVEVHADRLPGRGDRIEDGHRDAVGLGLRQDERPRPRPTPAERVERRHDAVPAFGVKVNEPRPRFTPGSLGSVRVSTCATPRPSVTMPRMSTGWPAGVVARTYTRHGTPATRSPPSGKNSTTTLAADHRHALGDGLLAVRGAERDLQPHVALRQVFAAAATEANLDAARRVRRRLRA